MHIRFNRSGLSFLHFRFGNKTGTVHFAQHHIAALGIRFRMAHRIPLGRILGDPGHRGRFHHRQILRGLGEIALRGSFHPVLRGAELRKIEIAGENLIFRHRFFDGDSVTSFVDFTRDSLFGSPLDFLIIISDTSLFQERIFHVLLGDRRTTRKPARGEIGDQRADGALHVNAVVLVKTPILNCDDGVFHMLRDLIGAHVDPVFNIEPGQHRSVFGQQDRLLRRFGKA